MRSAVHYAVHRPNCAIDVGKLDLRPRQRQVDTALTFGVDSAIAKQPECTRPRPLPFSSCTSAPSSALYLSFSAVSSTSAMNADVSFRSPTGSTTADYTRRNNHLQLHIEQPCRPALIHLILTVLVLATSPLSTLASTCADGIPASGVIPSDWPTRSFTLVISAATIATSDGGTKQAIAVNGSIPGPRLDANAYELLSITVVNQLNNVTGIHCHGLSFFSTPHLDGVPGLTQCGIPVGGSMTYTMCAMPSGTFWYHGHMDLQYVDGLYGALVIRSPNSSALTNPSLYQHDWVWQVADFYNLDSRYVLLPWFMSPASGGQEPQPDSLVVNGVFSSTSHLYAASTDRAIIRLINSGSLCMFYFAIDGVPLTVVELDGTEVYPYTVGSVMLNVAQRAVVTVSFADLASRYLSLDAVYYRVTMVPDADLTVDPYTAPFAVNFTQFDNWTGTLHINSPQSTSLPSYSTNSNDAPTLPPNTASQVEMNMLDARPVTYGSLRSGATVGSVPAATHSLSLEVVFANDASGVNLAYINDVTYNMSTMTATAPMDNMAITDSMTPPLYTAYSSPSSWQTPAQSSSVITGDAAGNYVIPYQAVVDVTILNTDTGEHPFHLHGQTFWLIATSDYPAAEWLYNNSWIMRDTVSVPAQGWAKLRFVADNPGIWMLHCHIDWHMVAGLVVVLHVALERVNPGFVYLAPDAVNQCDAHIQHMLEAAQTSWSATTDSSDSGLSTGAKIAIGVPVAVGGTILLLVLLCLVLHLRATPRTKKGHSIEPPVREADASSVSHRAEPEVELGTVTD